MSHDLKKGVTRGKKMSNKHQTIIGGADKLILTAKSLEDVTKVVLGKISHVGPGKRRIKFRPIRAGFLMVIRSSTAQQDIYIYTSNPGSVQSELERVWEELIIK